MTDKIDIFIIGGAGGTNVGDSFYRAAKGLGISPLFFNIHDAFAGPKAFRYACWHLLGRRPPRINSFCETIIKACLNYKPRRLLTTGLAPVHKKALEEIGRLGIRRINYATDDPWNRVHYAPWFLDTLACYDNIYSTRRANIKDFFGAGCKKVEYLPFAYDDALFFPEPLSEKDKRSYDSDIIFVGGADRDRAPYIDALIKAGFKTALYGSYWERYPGTRAYTKGQADYGTIRRATMGAKMALCLIRKANRDGHSMRSFEIPAIGTFMLTEDTQEHRDIFGEEGKAVVYFGSKEDMTAKARRMLIDKEGRRRMAEAAHMLVINGLNTYADRLKHILDAA